MASQVLHHKVYTMYSIFITLILSCLCISDSYADFFHSLSDAFFQLKISGIFF